MNANKGFTLIELMIVVAIIAIIAAIAIPNLMRSRMTANEGSAIGSMRAITSAEQQFQSATITLDAAGMGMYGTLVQLGAQVPPFVDILLSGAGQKQGYQFVVLPGGPAGAPNFVCNGDPLIMGSSGSRGFFADESGIMTFLQGAVAGPGDPVLQ